MLAEAAAALAYLRGPRSAAALVRRARELVATTGPAPGLAVIDATLGHAQVLLGDASGIALVERAVRPLAGPTAPEHSLEWGPRLLQLQTAKVLERFAVAEAAYQVGVTEAERAGNPLAVTHFGLAHADTLFRIGRLDDAGALLGAWRAVGELLPRRAHWAAVAQAQLCMEMDRMEAARRHCQEGEEAAGAHRHPIPFMQLWLLYVRMALALEDGSPEAAAALADRVRIAADDLGVVEPCVVPWAAVAVDAYAATGRWDDLEQLASQLASATNRLPCQWPRGVAAIARALLAEHRRDRAGTEAAFTKAVDHHRTSGMPLAEAATLTRFGAFLRRSGSPVRARELLGRAVRVAEATGATRLARQAHAELELAGGRRRGRAEADDLTLQEQRVTHLALRGLTNEEIGARLFISGRTVEHYLSQIYAKLGVASRRELLQLRDAGGLRLEEPERPEPTTARAGDPDRVAS